MSDGSPRRAVPAAAIAGAIVFACLFFKGGVLGFIGPDEPRYAAIAREMTETGDWITPRLHSHPWFEKPVLYYWAAAASFELSGVSESSARVPSAAAAALTLLALAWVGWRAYGGATAYAFALMFPTTVAAIGFGRAATTDMLFAATLSLALVAAARLIFGPRFQPDASRPRADTIHNSLTWLVLWGASIGLGLLAKGPAAVVLAGGSLALWLAATRRWRDLLTLIHPVGITACLAVALPWYLLCAARNPEFMQVFLLQHNLQRYLTGIFRHDEPLWYFGPILLLGLIPWTPLLVLLVRDGWKARSVGDWKHSLGLFISCWVAFPLIFFSLSQSKLPGYILPVVSPLMLLMAHSTRLAIERQSAVVRQMLAGVGGTFVLLAAAVFISVRQAPVGLRVALGGFDSVLAFAGAAVLAGGLIAFVALRRRAWLSIALAASLVAAFVLGLTTMVVPPLDAYFTARNAAAAVRRAAAARPIFVYQLHYAWRYGLDYYFEGVLPEWQTGETGVVVASEAGVRDLVLRGYLVRQLDRPSRGVVIVDLEPRAIRGADPVLTNQ